MGTLHVLARANEIWIRLVLPIGLGTFSAVAFATYLTHPMLHAEVHSWLTVGWGVLMLGSIALLAVTNSKRARTKWRWWQHLDGDDASPASESHPGRD